MLAQLAQSVIYCGSARDGNGDHTPLPFSKTSAPAEDLPYKVELWNAQGTAVELILAVTVSPSIGYAAYYAATREHPDRQVTLRHKNSIVSRWTGTGH